MIQTAQQGWSVVGVAVVGMRRGDDVLDAVGYRHAAHLLRHVPGTRAIVNFRKDVAVDVDQGQIPERRVVICDLSRFERKDQEDVCVYVLAAHF